LSQAYLDALECLVGLLEEQRDYPAAIRNAQIILRYDPLHEASYRTLIRLHALNGDRAGALRVYHACTTILRRELEVEPSAATRQAYEQLLGAEIRTFQAVPATAFSPLVGRESEWARILHAWRAVLAGGGSHIVILRGEAGIGKTRLAEELHQWADRQGILSASTRCFAAEGELAYAPVVTWLRILPLPLLEDVWLTELARLLPEVLARQPDLPRPDALTEAWQRQRLFEALSHAILAHNRPLLLIVDDLQWCDQDTLEWVHFLLRFNHNAQLLVVGAYRPEEIDLNHPLVSMLQALRHEGQVSEIDLPPLDEAETRTLATRIAGHEIGLETAQRLFRETEGNPLFVVETVRAGFSSQDRDVVVAAHRGLLHDPLAGEDGMPSKVQSVLEARLSQISPPSRELAGLAATIGREFSFKLLATASGCDEDTLVRQLDELWQRRIIREHGADSYDFSHDKLREVAYNSMSATRRRLLHQHTARALETLYSMQLEPVSYKIAAHYEFAGLPGRAAPYYLRAAEVARRVFANDEAIALLRRGIELADDNGLDATESATGHEIAAQLWEALGDILELRAQHEEALQSYHQAQSHAPNNDSIWQARLLRKEGIVLREQRLYAQALEACYQAESLLGAPPDEDSYSWLDEWLEVQVGLIWAYYWLARWPEMEALVNKLRPVVQKREKLVSRAMLLWASSLMNLRKEHYVVSDEMLAEAYEGLAASQELGSLKTRVEWHFEVGFHHLWRGELDQAGGFLQTALQLSETAGFFQMRTLSLTYLTVLHRFRGQADEVTVYAQRARQAAEAAQMPDYVAAAQGNQAWLAWRRQDLSAAGQFGQEALALWRRSPLVYPFQWQALWPLIAVALAQECEDDAWTYVQSLLAPTQQILPDELNAALETTIYLKINAQPLLAHSHLDRALELATEMGYL
jgi:hypothetical protein